MTESDPNLGQLKALWLDFEEALLARFVGCTASVAIPEAIDVRREGTTRYHLRFGRIPTAAGWGLCFEKEADFLRTDVPWADATLLLRCQGAMQASDLVEALRRVRAQRESLPGKAVERLQIAIATLRDEETP